MKSLDQTPVMMKLEGGNHYIVEPSNPTITVHFDLGTAVMGVSCRKFNDGSHRLQITCGNEIKIIPVCRDALYLEPIPMTTKAT